MFWRQVDFARANPVCSYFAMQPTPETPEAPTAIEAPETSARMTRKFDWGIPASVSVHAIVLALLIFGLPHLPHKPDEPKAVNVELVPPPEPKPKPKKPPEKPALKAEAKKPEEPKKKEDKPAEQAPKPPEIAKARQTPPPPVRMLRPVVEFGKQDAGPKKAENGDAAREASAAQPKPVEQSAQQPDAPKPDTPAPEAVPIPQLAPKPPAPAPTPTKEARKLQSQRDTGSARATTAIAGLPRGLRAGELCASALREKLQNALPPYFPELLPAYRLDKGNVLQVHRGAFRSLGEWYDLQFRCEIDTAATRVVSFTFDVGQPVPHSQWQARGFPAQ